MTQSSVSDELWSEFKRLYMEGLANEYTPHDDCLRAALEAIAPMLVTDLSEQLKHFGKLAAQHAAELEAKIAALEAVAPMLIAQGMREAATMTEPDHYNPGIRTAILARAQELDPK